MPDVDANQEPAATADSAPIMVEVKGRVAVVTLNRPQFGNAQNDHLLYQLDAALLAASNDDAVGAILLQGAGKHFSAGHDWGSTGRFDGLDTIERKTMWYEADGKPDTERLYVREQEVFLGLCRRWQDLPSRSSVRCRGRASRAG